jgi:hypothetical protein
MEKIIESKKAIFSIVIALLFITSFPQLSAFSIEEETLIDAVEISTLVPDLVYHPMSHDFGNVIEGQTYQTTFEIWNGGTDTLTWSLGIVNPWLMPTPMSGSSTGEHDTVTVQIDTTGLTPGPYSGSISIAANDGGGTRYFSVSFTVLDNDPPNTPSPLNGPSSGTIGDVLSYTTSTTDPDNDDVAYGLDFNNDDNIDHWSASFYPSGATLTFNIAFNSAGTFPIRVQAIDVYGALSDFSAIKLVTISGTSNDPPNTPSRPNGPNTGITGVSYTFSTSTTDPDGDQIKYGWDWNGDGTVDEWSGLMNSGSTDTRSNSWLIPGTYNVKVIAEDENGAQSSFSIARTIVISSNQPPNKPSISGPSSGRVGSSYTYSASTTDDDGDQIYYWFDWGDGTNTGWKGPFNSGQSTSESHIWTAQGTFSIKVKTKDSNDAEGVWSDPLPVSMPKNKSMAYLFEFLARFPRLSELFNGYF